MKRLVFFQSIPESVQIYLIPDNMDITLLDKCHNQYVNTVGVDPEVATFLNTFDFSPYLIYDDSDVKCEGSLIINEPVKIIITGILL